MALPLPNVASISIANKENWISFHEIGTEMVITKPGRNLFPKLQYEIRGLEPNKKYLACVTFELVDNKKYKFKSDEWLGVECCDPTGRMNYATHPDGAQLGDYWMEHGISFDRIKITNNSEDHGQNIVLQSMRKYRPVVAVFAVEDNTALPTGSERVAAFSDPLQDFVAVTAYQNQRIRDLKVRYNPYARGFRERTTKKKNSLSSTGSDSTPSPSVRRNMSMDSSFTFGSPSLYNSGQVQQTPGTPGGYFYSANPHYLAAYQQQMQPGMFQQLSATPSQFYPQVGGWQPWAGQFGYPMSQSSSGLQACKNSVPWNCSLPSTTDDRYAC